MPSDANPMFTIQQQLLVGQGILTMQYQNFPVQTSDRMSAPYVGMYVIILQQQSRTNRNRLK